jgi:hypothetical protein
MASLLERMTQHHVPLTQTQRPHMKSVIATTVSAILGALAGVTLWTIFGCLLLLLYWFGYIFVFLGIICGQPGGKSFGLGLMTPPEDGTVSMPYFIIATAFSFTWGEIFAAMIGGVCGAEAAMCGINIVTTARRLLGRKSPAAPK